MFLKFLLALLEAIPVLSPAILRAVAYLEAKDEEKRRKSLSEDLGEALKSKDTSKLENRP